MKTQTTKRARRALLALAAALIALGAGSGSAAAFGPLGEQFGVGFPAGEGSGIVEVPGGVAVGPDGSVFVSDISRQRVMVFDREGRFRFGFGKNVSSNDPGNGPEVCTNDCRSGEAGAEAGELSTPWGLAADANALYVAEQGNHRISVFGFDGRFLRAFGRGVGGLGNDVCTTSCQSGEVDPAGGSIPSPFALALWSGSVYVANSAFARVEVFDAASGAFRFAFGKSVGGLGIDTCTSECHVGVVDDTPTSILSWAIAAGPGGEIFIADLADRKVRVFDPNGAFLRQFGEGPGDGAGQISAAYGIAVDLTGATYVADIGNSRLAVFGPGGEFRAAYGRDVVPGGADGAEVCTDVCKSGLTSAGIGEFASNYAIGSDCRGSIYAGLIGRVERWGEPGVARPPCPPPPAPLAAQPPAKPSNAIKLGKLKLNRKKGTATLVVTVPGPGTLKASAGRKVSAKAPKPKRAGKVKVTIKARGKGVAELQRTGKLKGTLRLTYRPAGGDARTVTRKLTLKKTGYPRR